MNTRAPRLILATIGLALALVGVGCGTTVNFAPTNRPLRVMHARPVSEVRVFSSAIPQERYLDVGILQARQSSQVSTAGFADLIEALRNEAAQIGCDGIIIHGPDNTTELSGSGRTSVQIDGYSATCIVFDKTESPMFATAHAQR